MKRLLISLLVFVFPLFSTGALATAQGELGATSIEIDEWRDYVTQPIRIVALRYGNHQIESGEEFQATQDWIRFLSVRVKNVSGQVLRYVEVTVEFSRDDNQNPILAQVSLRKGFPYPFSQGPATRGELSLTPGAELELQVSEAAYEAYEDNRISVAPPDSAIRAAKVRTEAVAFSPNRIWMRGEYLNRNPQDPNQWILDQEEQDRMIQRIQRSNYCD